MIIFRNIHLLSFQPVAVSPPRDLAVDEHSGTIAAIDDKLSARYPDAEIVDGVSGYLSPGLVCAHTHLYSALARGILTPIMPSTDFIQTLQHLWWRLDRAIDKPILEASALAGCADAAMNGVTSLIDHHASPNFISGSLSAIAEAFRAIGLRGILCYETTDRNGADGARAGISENRRWAVAVASQRKAGRKSLLESAIGAHALFTIGDDTLSALATAVAVSGRGLHIHTAEDRYDASDSRYRGGRDLIDRLDDAGLLGPKTIIAHGVHLAESEIDTLNERGCFLAHNARSNMNNAVGYNDLLTRNKNVVLGTDGMGADMLEEFKFACFRQREAKGLWWPDDFLACLNRGNRILDRYFIDSPTDNDGVPGEVPHFGRLEVGAPADLVLWDYAPPTPLVDANVAGHLAFGLSSRSVRSTMVDGRWVVKDRRPGFDLENIAARGREQAARLWKRMEEL